MTVFSRRKLGQSFLILAGATRLRALSVHEALPHFSARTMDGERITSDSVKGKVLLLDFWATWCPPCKSDEPAVESIVKEFAPKGLMVVSVNMGEPRKRVKKYLESSPRSSKQVLAEDTTLAAICDAHSYPLYVLTDREGVISGIQKGAAGEGALRRLLAKAGLEAE